ncbi:hypothetical protein [Ensifer soli]|uniref:hypothetical protein n=1 Tax=Ciceribacter sp. sgz301302 TaxID=3342379 RepID=UPI0035BA47C0
MPSISELKIQPRLDPSAFEAGAKQMDAAAGRLQSSLRQVDVDLDRVSNATGRTRSQTELLSRKYVEGYGDQVKFATALRNISGEQGECVGRTCGNDLSWSLPGHEHDGKRRHAWRHGEHASQGAADRIDALLQKLPDFMRPGKIGDLGLDRTGLANPYLKELETLKKERETALPDIMSDTPLRDLGRRFTERVGERISGGLPETGPVPGTNPLRGQADEADRAQKAYDRLVQTTRERIADMELEKQSIGGLAVETERMRLETDLLRQAQGGGASITDAQRDSLKGLAAELANVSQQTRELRAMNDLSFDRDQLLRSPLDQQIAARQRQLGTSVDLNSPMAQYMRQNDLIKQSGEIAQGFASNFRSAMEKNGNDIGKSFGDAFKNSLLSAATKWQDQVFDRFGKALGNLLFGGNDNGGGGFLSNFLSGGKKADAGPTFAPNATSTLSEILGHKGANDPGSYAAPVGAVRGRLCHPA